MFEERDHIHTLMYDSARSSTATTTRFPSSSRSTTDPPTSVVGDRRARRRRAMDEVDAWFARRSLGAEVMAGVHPGATPRRCAKRRATRSAAEPVPQLYFVDDDLPACGTSGSPASAPTSTAAGSAAVVRVAVPGHGARHRPLHRRAALVPLPPHLKDLAARVSNWGRWGDDDERGTLNLIDAAAVRRGRGRGPRRTDLLVVDPVRRRRSPDRLPSRRRTNPELRSLGVNVSFTGDPADFTTSDDSFSMGVQAATHWDALAHAGYEGLLYNGIDNDVITERGARELVIERFGPIVTRGVLLDIARLQGVDHLDDGYAITGDDLDRALRRGWAARPSPATRCSSAPVRCTYLPHDRPRYSNPSPGLSTKSIDWFHDHDVAAVATDTWRSRLAAARTRRSCCRCT